MKISKKGECSSRSCCPMAGALDILGDRWTLLIVRDMMMRGKHEFQEFLGGAEGIATNILTNRLKGLVCLGIVDFIQCPKHKSKKIYYLTEKGKALAPLMMEMIVWAGTHYPAPDLPKEHFNKMKRDPKKFMRGMLQDLEVWERKTLKVCHERQTNR